MHNLTFLAAVCNFLFIQMAASVRNTYLPSYIYVVKPWTEYVWIMYLGITSMGLSILGPIAGLIHRRTHRYKSLMILGATIRLLGYGLLLDLDGKMTQSSARLILAQVAYAFGSFNAIGVRVGSQASVPHSDLATLISLITLVAGLGSSIGNAVSSAIWTNEMRDRIRHELPQIDEKTLNKMYGNIRKLRSEYDLDDPIRQGGIRAYAHVNGHIVIAGLVLSVVPLVASCFMPNYYLGKQQNSVTNTGLGGESVHVPGNNEGTSAPKVSRFRTWLAKHRGH
ncbi:hypothetical protein K4F52_005685 [Lecanicillium sp. MT-2017a]|nr:hypothetical protein K4F52_005685 [Lecanicillium sp. MT-2017a]